jgi:hypothetical protein
MGTVESDHTLKCQRFLEVPTSLVQILIYFAILSREYCLRYCRENIVCGMTPLQAPPGSKGLVDADNIAYADNIIVRWRRKI